MTIYIATTFREFDGSLNDQIQRKFLERIAREVGEEVRLVITIFGEKNVESVLDEIGVSYCVFDGYNADYRFSLTTVLQNALTKLELKNSDFLIWTTCDVLFEDNFFMELKKIRDRDKSAISIISHPHRIYEDLEALENNSFKIHGPHDGIDFVGFSAPALTKKFRNDIEQYHFSDWGVFELFLVAVAVNNNCNRYNMYFDTKVNKIRNDRIPNQETSEYFRKSLEKNWPIFDCYLQDNHLSSQYRSLAYCNYKYGFGSFRERLRYLAEFKRVYLRFVKRYCKQVLLTYIPKGIKSYIKHWVKI